MRTPLLVLKDIEAQIAENRGKKCIGIPFPWASITEVTSGLRPGMLYVCGGYTSAGKSAFANEIAYHSMILGRRVLLFSLEMSVETTMLRVAARHTGVPTLDILIGKYSREEWEGVREAFMLMEAADFLVIDDLYHLKKMRRVVEDEMKESPVDLVIIDFIQNIVGDAHIYTRMAQAALDCQAMARDLKIPLLVLSQVDNESVRNPSPIIGYKGAGEIAAAADVGFWMDRGKPGEKEYSGGQVKLEIRKHRHGKRIETVLYFEDKFTRLGDGAVSLERTRPYGEDYTQDPEGRT